MKAISEQLPDLLPHNLFCEPGPKDSMAAIGLAAAILARRDPNAVIGSFAADHMISGDDAFLSAVSEAVQVAKKDYVVTIGIAPSHPSTAFGYIRLGEKLDIEDAPNARIVQSFKEKPDARTAKAYINTGNYRWNAGMFVVKASFLLKLLKTYKPELEEGLQKVAAAWDDEALRAKVLSEVWPALEKIPIDNAVAEPAAAEGRVAVVPATFGWDDVGDFSSLADLLPAESNQSRVLGDHHLGAFVSHSCAVLFLGAMLMGGLCDSLDGAGGGWYRCPGFRPSRRTPGCRRPHRRRSSGYGHDHYQGTVPRSQEAREEGEGCWLEGSDLIFPALNLRGEIGQSE